MIPASVPPLVQLAFGDGLPTASTPPVAFTSSPAVTVALHSSDTLTPITKHSVKYAEPKNASKNLPPSVKYNRVDHGSFSGAAFMSEPLSQNLCASHLSGVVKLTAAPDKLVTDETVSAPLAPTVPMNMPLHKTPIPNLVSSSRISPVDLDATELVIGAPVFNHSANNVVSAEAIEATIALSAKSARRATPRIWIFFMLSDLPSPQSEALVEPLPRLEIGRPGHSS